MQRDKGTEECSKAPIIIIKSHVTMVSSIYWKVVITCTSVGWVSKVGINFGTYQYIYIVLPILIDFCVYYVTQLSITIYVLRFQYG